MTWILMLSLTAADHTLKATPSTVIVGYYDASTPPALRIRSGDTVTIETLGVGQPEMFEAAGVPKNKIEPARYAISARDPKARGHFLTGPIYVEGAMPGDVLEVEIRDIQMNLDYSYNGMGSNGVLADLFADRPRRSQAPDHSARSQAKCCYVCARSGGPFAAFLWKHGCCASGEPRDGLVVRLPGSTRAISTTRNSPWARSSTSRFMRKAHCFRWATGMLRRPTAKPIRPGLRLRSPASFASPSAKI